MKYYIIAGEASGDLHGANLMKGILSEDAHANFRFFGGDKMAQVGGELVKHYKEMAFMGFVEVVKNLPAILKNIKKAKQDILAYQPDALILIDYPGFNLKIAEFAKEKGIKVFYYISPKVWAWKESRVKKIKATVHRMITIFPFETAFYKKHGMDVFYVGNPLIDAIDVYKPLSNPVQSEKPILALLPGSRKQELEGMLPIMGEVAKQFLNSHQIVVAATPHFEPSFYRNLLGFKDAEILVDRTYDILSTAQVAMVTSGTATLETALFKVPQVVCYRGNKITIWIAKRLIKLKYISLVNLVVDAPLVKELIQEELNQSNLYQEVNDLVSGEKRTKMLLDYDHLIELLEGSGASKRAAKVVIDGL